MSAQQWRRHFRVRKRRNRARLDAWDVIYALAPDARVIIPAGCWTVEFYFERNDKIRVSHAIPGSASNAPNFWFFIEKGERAQM